RRLLGTAGHLGAGAQLRCESRPPADRLERETRGAWADAARPIEGFLVPRLRLHLAGALAAGALVAAATIAPAARQARPAADEDEKEMAAVRRIRARIEQRTGGPAAGTPPTAPIPKPTGPVRVRP